MDYTGVSGRLWAVRRVQWMVVAVPVTVVAAVILWLTAGPGPGIAALVGLVVVAGLWLRALRGRCRAWGYAERDTDLVVRRGVLLRRVSVVPYGRMQFIDVTAGPVERSFGLATVQLHTAAAASDARIPGLEAAEATRLRDSLARGGQTQAAGL